MSWSFFPAGVSTHAHGGDLPFLLILLLQSAPHSTGCTEEHSSHQTALQGSSAHALQVLQQPAGQQEGEFPSSFLPAEHQLTTPPLTLSASVPPQDQLGVLMSIMKDHISQMETEQLSFHQSELTAFFLTALDFRAGHCQVSPVLRGSGLSPNIPAASARLPQDDLQKASEVEGGVIECLMTMVMKLSEFTFRPLFFKVTSSRLQKRLFASLLVFVYCCICICVFACFFF